MKYYLLLALTALAFILPLERALALEPAAQVEVDHLLSYVEKSGCRFIRNGNEYRGAEGAAHLGMKLSRAGGRVKTAEDFIAGIASKSSFSGSLYMVKAPDGRTFATGEWLTAELARWRKEKGAK